MYICKECLEKNKERYKDCGKSILPMSHGPCELCHEVKDCHEVYIHDSHPMKFKREATDIEIITFGDQKIFLRPKDPNKPLSMMAAHQLLKSIGEQAKAGQVILIPSNLDMLVVSKNGDVTKV